MTLSFESYLDLKASLVLSDDPLLQLCASPRLLLSLVQTALLLRLQLGIADLLFSTGCLQGLLLLEQHQLLGLLPFLLLNLVSLIVLLLQELLLSHCNVIFDVILHVLVALEKHAFLEVLLASPLVLDSLLLLVPLLHVHDIFGLLLSLLDLLPCLHSYLIVRHLMIENKSKE